MVVDYFTKWFEVEVLASITPAKINEFVYKNIVCRYRVPHTIISDNDKLFDYDEFKEFCDNLHIKKVFSSVMRRQANGQVKAVNKIIKYNLKTKLEDLKRRWVDKLPEVLWDYRTTARSTIRENPILTCLQGRGHGPSADQSRVPKQR